MELGRLYDGWQRATAMAARALAAFYASGASLNPTIVALRRAETDGVIAADEGSVSELRALRYGLLELQRRAGDRWLRVGRGKLVYLYPFAVRGVEPSELVEAVEQDEASRWELAGTSPVRTHGSLDLDDVWKSHDDLGHRYDGALVVMPDAVVRAPDGRALAGLGVQVRHSLLGNHYVRFEADLADVSAVELFAMLFWAGPEVGALDIGFDGTGGDSTGGARPARDRPRWPRLSALAMDLAQDSVPARLGATRAVVCRPGLYFPTPGDTSIHEAHPNGYNREADGSLRDYTELDPSWGWTAGAVVSTTGDISRFYTALLGGRLLPAAQLTQMRTTVPADEVAPGVRYGLGLVSRPLSCGGVYWGHGGTTPGYRSRDEVTDDGRAAAITVTTVPDEAGAQHMAAALDAALCR
ncbi:serine hydrolase [Kitasatospora sp. NPDC006786]|uniref:serine hydrolase n=1 Tax=unclassified Kitasatospora TaxID=2633591 RepID=UPI0033D28909